MDESLLRVATMKKSVHVHQMRSGHAVAPHLQGKAVVTPADTPVVTLVGPTVGFQYVPFAYVDVGGTGNLKPGFVSTQSAVIAWPPGAGRAIVMLKTVEAAFVDESGNISDHHLGDFIVQCYFKDGDSTNVYCDFLLRDNSQDEGVNMFAEAWLLFFEAV
jgi:hypothetical protein